MTLNYFISSRWASLRGRQNVKFKDIRLSSAFVISGDCTAMDEYPPPFGIAPRTTIDCDKSDETKERLVFADEPGGLNIHRAGNNVLFADGHVASFRTFDISSMTFDVSTMKSWADTQ